MNTTRYEPRKPLLLALGVGTALACVCALGIAMIQRRAPGLWAVVAVALAFCICRVLASVYGHLVKTVPSGAGMFAFVARAWGPTAGVAIIAPYLLLMIMLGALEALIVGYVLQPWFALPITGLACCFLFLCWAICASGLRFSLGVQAAATSLLILGLLLAGGYLLWRVSDTGQLIERLWQPAPSMASLTSGVAEALFLFMGFELVCAQIESSRAEAVHWALRASVWCLGLLYSFVVLAASTAAPVALASEGIAALLPLTDVQDSGLLRVALILCLLSAVSSLNGAFLGLSRLVMVLAGQGILPRRLAQVHGPSLLPRAALTALLLTSVAATLAIHAFSAYQAVMLAAAVMTTALYALALVMRLRPPFQMLPPTLGTFVLHGVLCLLLVGIAMGVVADAGSQRLGLLSLLLMTFGVGGFVAWKKRKPV